MRQLNSHVMKRICPSLCRLISLFNLTNQRNIMLSLCLIKNNSVKTHRGWRISPRIRNLANRWRWQVSSRTRPLYPQGKRLRYPLDRRLSGPHSLFGTCGGDNFLSLLGTEPRFLRRPPRSLFVMPTELSQAHLNQRNVLKFPKVLTLTRLWKAYWCTV
jgi:hypothetical protein